MHALVCESKSEVSHSGLCVYRSNFSLGKMIAKERIAFTDPTPDGKAFAAKYCETSNFLVYRWS